MRWRAIIGPSAGFDLADIVRYVAQHNGLCVSRAASINVLVNNPLGHGWPRCLLLDVVDKWRLRGAGHVVNDDVWLGCKSLKQIGELVDGGILPAIFDADG